MLGDLPGTCDNIDPEDSCTMVWGYPARNEIPPRGFVHDGLGVSRTKRISAPRSQAKRVDIKGRSPLTGNPAGRVSVNLIRQMDYDEKFGSSLMAGRQRPNSGWRSNSG